MVPKRKKKKKSLMMSSLAIKKHQRCCKHGALRVGPPTSRHQLVPPSRKWASCCRQTPRRAPSVLKGPRSQFVIITLMRRSARHSSTVALSRLDVGGVGGWGAGSGDLTISSCFLDAGPVWSKWGLNGPGAAFSPSYDVITPFIPPTQFH